ncbi:MAG: YbaB/EbfC family nucleoid-associated protein [Candidatus Latescibacteria bacterium]|nr:YbaB/EbfC family nucleoid-associated protein [bacterium]MBD3423835.1 YbaB/EbfC family nucleoid-associated protein [Candidatus Latescibacterota bacterium]
MKNMGKMLKQMQQMQKKISQMQEEVAEQTVETASGGGMVKVVMNGAHEVVSIQIDPEVVDPEDIEMLEELVAAAVNEANNQVDAMIKEKMGSLTGGLPIPDIF